MSYKRARTDSQNDASLISFEMIGEPTERTSQRFQRSEKVITYRLLHNLGHYYDLHDVASAIDEAYAAMVSPHLTDASEMDLITVTIEHEDLEREIYLPPRQKRHFHREDFLDSVYQVAQSTNTFLLDGQLDLTIAVVKNLTGTSKPKTVQELSKAKRSVVVINNSDNCCFFRALYVVIIHSKKVPAHQWKSVAHDKAKKQYKGALELSHICSWDINAPVTRNDMPKIQQFFPTIQIVVVDAHQRKNLIFKGPPAAISVYIEYQNGIDGGHYNAITNIKGYMGRVYYCARCHYGYNNKNQHKCSTSCVYCHADKKHDGSFVTCNTCNREFKGLECYNEHLPSLCSHLKKCTICDRQFRTNIHHECMKFYCQKCNTEYKEQPHFCYVEPLNAAKTAEEDNAPKIFVLYDIESVQLQDNDVYRHVPNLLISNMVCDHCFPTGNCNSCHGFKTFLGRECIHSFGDYLYNEVAKIADQMQGRVYAFAHNARGYDAHFILRDLWLRNFDKPEVIMQGRKILRISVGNIRLVDSLAFFLQPLAALPKAFGLQVEMEKGYFPHLFNLEQNWSYEGPLPPLEYFGVKYLKPDASSKLTKWHQELLQQQYVFKFMPELIKYCKNDVEILTHSVMVFRSNFKNITGLDPYTRCFTLASIGLEVFRAKLLKPMTLAITPVNGYTSKRKASKMANAWLDWKQIELNTDIKREYHLGKYFADGFIPTKNHVLEFFGCHWHGCPCSGNTTKLQATQERILHYQNRGFQLTFIWECQYKEQRQLNQTMREYTNARYAYYSKLEKHGGCVLKESFFGGRTNNLKFYHQAVSDEEIKYVDFCSLYPFVLKTKIFPIGHPTVIRENIDHSLEPYFGFAKCRVLPPQKLYLGVLPVRVQDKLMFPLCRTCALNLNKHCSHDPSERELIGTWTTVELKEALKQNYRITEVFEVLHYTEVTDQLFKPYINMWLKIKQEASGWPQWCKTDQDKQDYVHRYFSKESIGLDPEKIDHNGALRFIAKIMLNSFWGKLAQRPNMSSTSFCHNYNDYFSLAIDPKKTPMGEVMVTDDLMVVNWKWNDDIDAPQGKTNLAVASYVTAYARLELYRVLQQLHTQRPYSVLYFDTDSVIYYRKFNDPELPTGDFLGDLTDEIQKDFPGAICNEFASLGPKNYSYQVVKPDGTKITPMKIKGLSLTLATMDMITFQKMVQMAQSYSAGEVLELACPQQQFKTDQHHNIVTRHFNKILRATADKRYITNNETFPYGFIQ